MSDDTDDRVPWLFVLTRADLPPEVQTIQLGHACAEAVPPELAPLDKRNRMAWLHARDESHLLEFAAELEHKSIAHAVVYETDGDHAGHATALAVVTLQRSKLRKLLHHLPLAKF